MHIRHNSKTSYSMKEKKDLLNSVETANGFVKVLKQLNDNRRLSKVSGLKRSKLTGKQRALVLTKTDSHCHVCGIKLGTEWQADHVKAHITGGVHVEKNYLPSCSTCNNYRWHYSPEEIQIILKLGVWMKTKIIKDSKFGLEMASKFVKYEMGVRKRRKAIKIK